MKGIKVVYTKNHRFLFCNVSFQIGNCITKYYLLISWKWHLKFWGKILFCKSVYEYILYLKA
jgi:hypothetical protein